MNREELDKELKEAIEIFYKEVHPKVVNAVNSYLEVTDGTNPTGYSISHLEGISKLDSFAFLTAWAVDHLNGREDTFVGGKGYRGSLTKKIRKALGYTL